MSIDIQALSNLADALYAPEEYDTPEQVVGKVVNLKETKKSIFSMGMQLLQAQVDTAYFMRNTAIYDQVNAFADARKNAAPINYDVDAEGSKINLAQDLPVPITQAYLDRQVEKQTAAQKAAELAQQSEAQ